MKSIVEQIFDYGRKNPDKTALQNGKESISFGQMLDGIICARNILSKNYNVKKGSKVIIAADKQLEFVLIYFACHLLEAITLPIAPDTNEKRYRLIKEKSKPVLVIGFDNFISDVNTADFSDFDQQILKCDDLSNITFPDMESVADIMFTTGTTGEPKGVLLSHRNISAAARNINAFVKNKSEYVEMLALPISHSFGIGRMRCALSNGQTLIMLGSFANIKRFFRFIDDYKVNGFGMVPSGWAVIKKLSGDKLFQYQDQLCYIEIGSAPMTKEDKNSLLELLPNTRICMHYGLTEASRSAFIEFHEDSDRLETVGKQTPGMQVTIRDEHGNELPSNAEGEICVKGDAVSIGYLDLPKSDYFFDDFFRTGDWGSCDENGYISLKSRKKELINVGGKKVSPIEVEEMLKNIDFVKDCACVGIADPEGILGEVIKAFIVTDEPDKLTFEQMEKFIGTQLESYKHPIFYEQIDEIPKTSSGKIQRLSLK